jgi:hypothetical protein
MLRIPRVGGAKDHIAFVIISQNEWSGMIRDLPVFRKRNDRRLGDYFRAIDDIVCRRSPSEYKYETQQDNNDSDDPEEYPNYFPQHGNLCR